MTLGHRSGDFPKLAHLILLRLRRFFYLINYCTLPEASYGNFVFVLKTLHDVLNVVFELLRLSKFLDFVCLFHIAHHGE